MKSSSSSSSSSSVPSGNMIVLLISVFVLLVQCVPPPYAHKELQLTQQSDYGSSSGSGSAEDMIDPLTALAPFASLDVYREDMDTLSDTDANGRSNHVTEDAAMPPHRSSASGSVDATNTANNTAALANSAEIDGRAAGTLLDEFSTGKLNNGDASNTLPIFLIEPENVFVVKNRPAVLKCKAAHALQLHFKCSGSSQPPPSTHDKHVDPHSGVHVEEVTATIHRDLVDEYFGKGSFRCECHAWSSRGVVKSQAATVNIAYIRKSFAQSPTSLRVELGSRAELHCESPGGYPEPKVSWSKNNVPLLADNEPSLTLSGGTVTFRQVALQDMANYTCSAENIAGKRTSDSAVLIVYVDGGWSSWSPWRECKCAGKPSLGRKRTRICTNPLPMNGGAQCNGPQIQKSADCAPCPEDTQIVNSDGFDITSGKRIGRWSAWSDWSICSMECIQVRRRKCLTYIADDEELDSGGNAAAGSASYGSNNGGSISASSANGNIGGVGVGGGGGGGVGGVIVGGGSGSAGSSIIGVGGISFGGGALAAGYGKSLCSGKDTQTAECRGEHCLIGKDDFDWTLYLGLAFITAVCFAFGAALICCARRGIRSGNPHYNMARSVMDAEYMPGVDKKEMRMHIEAANLGYDYVNPGHRFLPTDHIVGTCGIAEHHYDVPNLAANYTNPIDDINGDYLTDTGESSTADTSNSTFDMTAKLSILSASKSTAYELLTASGGHLRLYGGDIMLYVPELAIGKHLKKHVSLLLPNDECSRVSIPFATTDNAAALVCSTVVHCAPRNYSFVKPVVLKIPHCLVEPERWHVYIYHADSEHDELNLSWRRVIAVGEETINTPVFVQLEATHVYIMTEQLGHFAVVADAKLAAPCGGDDDDDYEEPSIKMKLIAYSQHTPSNANSSLRIYVVKDFPNSRDICTNVESKLGGSYMGESPVFAFYLNNDNLNIRVRSANADALASSTTLAPVWETHELYEHVIPYNHILSNNSILHCEFSMRGGEPLELAVDFAQCEHAPLDSGATLVYQTFSIAMHAAAAAAAAAEFSSAERSLAALATATATATGTTTTTISINRQGNYVNDTTGSLECVQLPRSTKRLICAALDPPRTDERDWRLLAKQLNTDRYIAYFATKPSPTEQILNLWECRAYGSNSQTIMQLLLTLKEMGRQDVMDIIVDTIGPLWI